ncbi:MAG: hypothetical protein ACXAC7_13025 [Candidatus Hodarchaeales archaeon]|jgi:hypothetical protein
MAPDNLIVLLAGNQQITYTANLTPEITIVSSDCPSPISKNWVVKVANMKENQVTMVNVEKRVTYNLDI